MYLTCGCLFSVASSDEDEDDIFSDDLVERVSDSESGGEEQVKFRARKNEAYYNFNSCVQDPVAHEKARRFMVRIIITPSCVHYYPPTPTAIDGSYLASTSS